MSIMRIVVGGGGNPYHHFGAALRAGLNLTGVEIPKILLVPTPKYTAEAHAQSVAGMTAFGHENGLPVEVLHKFGELPSPGRLAELLDWANAIYVTGGNTRYMMEQWTIAGFLDTIRDAVRTGKVVATGISAGMLAWLGSGHSDSLSYEVPEGTPWDYIPVDGLGIIRAVGCPHLDSHHPLTGQPRRESFEQMLAKQPNRTVGIGLDESAGMQIIGGQVRVLSAGPPGSLHRFVRVGSELEHSEFEPSHEPFPLEMFVH